MKKLLLVIFALPALAFGSELGGWSSYTDAIQKYEGHLTLDFVRNKRNQFNIFMNSEVFEFKESGVENLYSSEIGMYIGKNYGTHGYSLYALAGNQSDKILRHMDRWSWTLFPSYYVRNAHGGQWMYSIFFFNNKASANYIPIPGVMYSFKSRSFSGTVGFPIMDFNWKLTNHFGIKAKLVVDNSVDAKLYYNGTFFQYLQDRNSFMFEDAESERDRKMLSEQSFNLGQEIILAGGFLEIVPSVGYVNKRSLKVRNKKGDTLSVKEFDSEWQGRLDLNLRF